MAVASNIEVLELRFEIDSSVLNSKAILRHDIVKLLLVLRSYFEILSPSKISVFLSDWLNCCNGILVNTFNCESRVYGVAEVKVVEQIVGVVGLVLLS